MIQDEIIDLVREADLDWHAGWTLDDEAPNRFETFAKLVAAKEREACAKTAEQYQDPFCGQAVADEIRARGEA